MDAVNSEADRDSGAETSAQKMQKVLQCFSVLERSLSVSEIAERTGMPRSTAHRWCVSLREIGFLDQDHARDEYRLGLSLLQLGNTVLSSMDLQKQQRPIVESLTQASQEGVHLGVFDGISMVFVSHTPGGPLVRNNSTTLVESSPCYCTSVGKAALAFQPAPVVQRIIDMGLVAYTRNTITDPDKLREELRIIRERGYALNNGEFEPHTRCIGAPIRNASGKVIAAISVTGTSKRLPDSRVKNIAPLVVQHADALSIQLGYRIRGVAT
ncbi:IclR family transcriptional regulator [Bradyrhizobium neotropicale]|uniref:IclR family transcriptional regulator n=1 Tax=Bradyrhizobium neotropicale TaxID=1497615 RepID=UPI001AD64B7B|nr:IclR family transcriptional regulator [Bradyrhizobium neotropicale]MBO4223952.1 helix-turn-helix domain-containing protein [Bradyrhizobium neotropicale]